MELTFNHLLRSFSNAEASLQFRDVFVPTGCWGEKKRKRGAGGSWACAWDRKGKERHASKPFPPSHSSFHSSAYPAGPFAEEEALRQCWAGRFVSCAMALPCEGVRT